MERSVITPICALSSLALGLTFGIGANHANQAALEANPERHQEHEPHDELVEARPRARERRMDDGLAARSEALDHARAGWERERYACEPDLEAERDEGTPGEVGHERRSAPSGARAKIIEEDTQPVEPPMDQNAVQPSTSLTRPM